MTYVEYITEVCTKADLIKRLRRQAKLCRLGYGNRAYGETFAEAADYIESMEEA